MSISNCNCFCISNCNCFCIANCNRSGSLTVRSRIQWRRASACTRLRSCSASRSPAGPVCTRRSPATLRGASCAPSWGTPRRAPRRAITLSSGTSCASVFCIACITRHTGALISTRPSWSGSSSRASSAPCTSRAPWRTGASPTRASSPTAARSDGFSQRTRGTAARCSRTPRCSSAT